MSFHLLKLRKGVSAVRVSSQDPIPDPSLGPSEARKGPASWHPQEMRGTLSSLLQGVQSPTS